MSAALGALLLFLMIHAAVEVIFSSGYFLPFGYGALAVVNLCCGDLLPLTFAKESARRWMARVEGLGLAVFAVLLCMNLWAASLVQQGSYDAAQEAADLDPHEWADHKLSYVYSASAGERSACRYAGDAGALYGGSGEAELQLRAQVSGGGGFPPGPHGQGFAMLDKYVDYTPSDPDTWDASFRLVMQYNDNSAAFLAGASQLRDKLTEWNAQNLGAITLKGDVAAYLSEMLG